MRSTRRATARSEGRAPPEGDNVTTQQALDTMRALQAEVAASRADNAELCRANEELRRGLQHVGERTADERAPPVPLRARPMSFSRAIMNVVLPTRSLGPKVSFTGVEDPEAHLTAFHTQMMLTGGFDAVYCKMLMSTLSGATLEWFISLFDGHITSFDQFCHIVQGTIPCQQGPHPTLLRRL